MCMGNRENGASAKVSDGEFRPEVFAFLRAGLERESQHRRILRFW
jgi:hypothetical protein